MLNDSRYDHLRITLLLTVLIAITYVANILVGEIHFFGIEQSLSLTSFLALDTQSFERFFYLNFVTSFFSHLNINHLLSNIFMFFIAGLLVEKSFKRFEYVLFIFGSHLLSLVVLVPFIEGRHVFLGCSSVVYSLLSFYACTHKKVGLIIALILSLVILYWMQQDLLGIISHIIGVHIGIVVYLIKLKFQKA
jgi:membrane associated rhomboid family serine protease